MTRVGSQRHKKNLKKYVNRNLGIEQLRTHSIKNDNKRAK